MKPISICLLGLSFAALSGCGAEPTRGASTPESGSSSLSSESFFTSEYARRSILWQGARFWVTFPCHPRTSPRGPTVDETEFGTLRAQSYKCEDTEKTGFLLTAGVFESTLAEPFGEKTKQTVDAEIATEFARQLCNAMTARDKNFSCSPGSPVDMGGVTDVEVSFGPTSHRFAGRVRVSYPYLVNVAVIGNVEWDNLQKALDIKLPPP